MTLTDAPRAKAPAVAPAPAPDASPPTEAPTTTAAVTADDATTAVPPPAHCTLEQYHAAIEAGELNEYSNVELLDEQVIRKMSKGKRHDDTVNQLNVYFMTRFMQTYICRVQSAVTLPPGSEPEPDYAVIDEASYRGRGSSYRPGRRGDQHGATAGALHARPVPRRH